MKAANHKNIRCIILAAGLGTRMNTELPKPLLRVGNRTMLQRLVETVKSIGIQQAAVVVGHGSSILLLILLPDSRIPAEKAVRDPIILMLRGSKCERETALRARFLQREAT